MCQLVENRSRDSDGSASRGSQEREYRRSDEKAPTDRGSHRTSDSREERRGNDRNGEYDGPSGMQPDGLIEVFVVNECMSVANTIEITTEVFAAFAVVYKAFNMSLTHQSVIRLNTGDTVFALLGVCLLQVPF